MRSYHIETFHNTDGIVIREHDMPVPGPYELLVKVHATSLNRRDLSILHESYPLPAKPGVVPVSDGAGEVVAVGSRVSRFSAGDRVAGSYFPRWRDGRIGVDIVDQPGCTIDGMLAEYVILTEDGAVQIPEYLSYEQAATLPCAALTAWSALAAGPVIPGSTILTIGSGGVALFAIQFAGVFGAQVIALTSRAENTSLLKSAGATHVLNYQVNPNWSADVLALTGGRGVIQVMETGGTDTLEQSILATALGGQITLLSYRGTISTDAVMDLNKILTPLFARLITVKPHFVGNRLDFEAMNEALSLHQIVPVIDRVFAFEEAREAYRYFAVGQHRGKVVIHH
jgi:NADPH:quinone reductase-like Zn-dependent oxidoreductase